MRARVLLAALAFDALVGEVPNRVHPVVGMGRVLTALETLAPRASRARFVFGTVVAIGHPVLWALCGAVVERRGPWPAQAALLSALFAGRALLAAATRVERDLQDGDLAAARADLAALVSRPTASLDAPRAAAAAIESTAENLVDSWVAPLAAYAVFGLAGAGAYRAINTADAMWGYRDARYEWLGKASARLDDVVNWLPARATALGLLLVAPMRLAGAQDIWRQDAGRTASPNAGQPMAAMAGVLDVQLEKVDHYVLHAAGKPPTPSDIARANAIARRVMVASAALAMLRCGVRGI
jgi:adenosylcobinamide-phosphate synthase